AAFVTVKVTANLGCQCEPWRHRQTNSRHLVEVCSLAAKERLHAARSVGVPVAEVVNVTRYFRFSSGDPRALLRCRSCPYAPNSFSTVGFSFCSHDLGMQPSIGRRTRQSSFGRHGVNAAGGYRKWNLL